MCFNRLAVVGRSQSWTEEVRSLADVPIRGELFDLGRNWPDIEPL